MKKALMEKWKIQTAKGKHFDCLQIAMYMDDVLLKAKSAFAIACNIKNYVQRKDYLK